MTKFKNHLQNHRVNSNKTWRNVSLFEGNLSSYKETIIYFEIIMDLPKSVY